jgi:hypothetical protein
MSPLLKRVIVYYEVIKKEMQIEYLYMSVGVMKEELKKKVLHTS